MKIFLVFIILTFFFLPAIVSGAEYSKDYQGYFIIKNGFYTPKDDLEDFDKGYFGGITIGGHIIPYLAIESSFSFYTSKYSSYLYAYSPELDVGYNVSEEYNVNVVPVELTLKGVFPIRFVELYAGMGGGVYYVISVSEIKIGSKSENEVSTDIVKGFHFIGGVNVNVTKQFFVGICQKIIKTEEAFLKGEFFGIPVIAKTNVNGYTTTLDVGFRF